MKVLSSYETSAHKKRQKRPGKCIIKGSRGMNLTGIENELDA